MEGHGVSKKEKVSYFNPNRWREQKLKAMVNAAMKEKNAAFLEEHRNDTGEQLLNYLSEVGHPVLSMEPFDM